MITLLNVIDTGGPGGAETVFLNLACGLDPREFRLVNVVSREGWLTNELRARGASAPLVISASGSMNVGYLRKLMRTARELRADVIVAHLYGSAVYCSLAGKLLGIPVVSVLHGQSDISHAGRFGALKKMAVRAGTSRLVFVSERLAQELAARLGAQSRCCAVIANGIDVAKYASAGERPLRAELALRDDEILVGAVGNIRAPKSYGTFLRAARELCDRSPRYRFAIAGEGSGPLYQELLELRRSLGLEQRVTFLGLRADVPEILRSFDVYALSSTTEGFSIACIEAMASGVPVVSTRSGGPEEILEHESTGLLVPVSDPGALAQAIDRLASDPGLASQMSAAARRRVVERYTIEAMLSAYSELFRSLGAHR